MTQNTGPNNRDHGGGLDAAMARFGGSRRDWIDLSTGINPVPYPLPDIPSRYWQALPDSADQTALKAAARRFWSIPEGADIAAASGVSALIAALPRLSVANTVSIATPTYNEHAASFSAFGWRVQTDPADTNVYVHPNNPDGRLWSTDEIRTNHKTLSIIDESFCDTTPELSHIALADQPGIVILKGLGKFWGLAGLRLGFAIARPDTIAQIENMLGPWAISGPAQHIGATALKDTDWAAATRIRLRNDAQRLDHIMTATGATNPCGTTLFRSYHVADAHAWFEKRASARILSRVFPYSTTMVRLGLPQGPDEWARLEQSLE